MMRQVAGDGNVSAIEHVAGRRRVRGSMIPGFGVRLGASFSFPRVERAGAKGNPGGPRRRDPGICWCWGRLLAAELKGTMLLCDAVGGIESEAHGQGSCCFEEGSSLHLAPLE